MSSKIGWALPSQTKNAALANVWAPMWPIVTRVVTTRRSATTSGRICSDRRCAGSRVSPKRRVQTSATADATNDAANTPCHGANNKMPAPMIGTKIGPTRNTAVTIVMIRAIRSPS